MSGRITREEMRRRWLERQQKDPVEIVEARIEALPNAFQERAAKEQDRRTDATDSRYWIAVCFQTREQKEEFLLKSGLVDLAEAGDYLDGAEVAEHLDVELTSPTPKWRDSAPKKKLADLT
jgi:hypothetical protein